MPYPAPTIATAGPTASDTATRFEDLRAYVNAEGVAADLAAGKITAAEIVRGEYAGVVAEHQFATGDLLVLTNDGEPIHRDYFTAQIKGIDPKDQTIWHKVPETGKVVSLENSGHILYQCSLEVVCDRNYQLDYDTDGTVNNDGLSTLFKLMVNGVVQDDTNSHHGEQNHGIATGVVPSNGVFGAAGNKQRTCYITWMSGTLAAGEHELVVVCNPVVDKGYRGSASVTIECFEF